MPMINTDGRHESVAQVARWLEPNPDLPAEVRDIAVRCAELAQVMLARLPDGPELTTGLRKLLEAKDCFVRQAVASDGGRLGWGALRA